MMSQSLTVRTIAAGMIWIAIALGIGGWVIMEVFRSSATRQFDARLEAELDLLTVSLARSEESLSEQMINPDYLRVYSGSYWQAEGQDSLQFRSRSLWDSTLPDLDPGSDLLFSEVEGPDTQTLRLAARKVLTPGQQPWKLSVAANKASLQKEIERFQNTLLMSATILAVMLLGAAFMLLRSALAPLKALRRAVVERHSNGDGQIIGSFPVEISPLVDDLNSMLQRNERLREKGRLQAANLAHALKTPSAILRNEIAKAARGEDINITIAEQAVENVSAAADRHLTLAVASPEDLGRSVDTDMVPVAKEAISAMERLFPDVKFELDAPNRAPIGMSRSDQLELFGNVLENAGKWARSRINVSINKTRETLQILVDDDGPGIPPENRQTVFKQGVRLDHQRKGSGLGLTIVADIISRYHAHIDLETSQLGGLRVRIVLPDPPKPGE